MRALPHVEDATFDIPNETFTIKLRAGGDAASVLRAITKLGFTPEVIDEAPPLHRPITNNPLPSSAALQDGLARADARDVPLVIVFGGPFCPLCRKFQKHTLQDGRVAARLKAFEVVHIDIEEDKAAANDLDVHAVPDLWILTWPGVVVARHNGYLNAGEFLTFLDRASKR